MLIILVHLLQLLEDLLIELVLNQLSPYDGVGLDVLILLDILSDLHDLSCLEVELLLLLLLLGGLLLALGVDGVDCEEDLPEDTFDESSDDVDDGDVEEAKEEHHEDEVIWGSPRVVEGYLRPARFC